MEHQMKLTIDYTRKAGTVRRLNGVNLAPPPIAEKASRDLSADFAALRAPYARLHDAPLENGNMRLVDVPFLFGNCDADAADKANYYFRQTDDYLATCRRCGSDIIYRLGVSIEHGIGRYYAFPPEDFEKWSDICVNIVRHYNEGWNDGFAWNIRYWEIWNEPDLAGNMWNAPLERYFELYALTAKKLKARFPGIRVGGPAYACSDPGRINAFLDACRAADAPLDFFSWHCYTADPAEIAAQPARMRALLDAKGFTGTELHLNEWHYFNADWRQYRNDRLYCREANRAMDGLHGIDSAAFLTSVMTGWQDGPITMGCYYTAGLCWGVFDKYAVPYKTYYALKAFGDLTDFPLRRRTGSDRENVRLLAGCDPGGNAALLVSSFKNAEPIELGISGADLSAMRLLRLDCELDLEPVEPEFRDGKLILTPTASSNVWFLPGIAAGK